MTCDVCFVPVSPKHLLLPPTGTYAINHKPVRTDSFLFGGWGFDLFTDDNDEAEKEVILCSALCHQQRDV